MTLSAFGTEIPTTQALTDNHRAVVWSLAAATGPLPLDSLVSSLDVETLPCGPDEVRRVRAWLTEILADLHQAGLVAIAREGRQEHLPSRHMVSAAALAPQATVVATEDGLDLAAALFIN